MACLLSTSTTILLFKRKTFQRLVKLPNAYRAIWKGRRKKIKKEWKKERKKEKKYDAFIKIKIIVYGLCYCN